MKFRTFIALGIMAFASAAFCQRVVINEIMYDPSSPEPKWVELFNTSDTARSTVGWTISNHLRTYQLIADTIAPHQYMIITKDSAQYLRKKYSIPMAHILETPIPIFRITGDSVFIKDSLGNIMDSLTYAPKWGGGKGISLERIDYSAPSDSSNFGSCIDSLGATPGKENSIHRRDYDLALISLTYSPSNQTDLTFTATILNKGRKEISDGTVTLFVGAGMPIAVSQINTPINPLEKQDINVTWENALYGNSQITAIINESQDEDHSNDTIYSQCYLPIPRDAIVINEIMATPATGFSQWIELYNNSPNVANMDSTALKVKLDTKFYTFQIDSFRFAPKQYAVICADSNFYLTFPLLKDNNGIRILGKPDFHLKDTGNVVLLTNSDGSIIDSLHFYSTWYLPVTKTTGISLERKSFSRLSTDPSNWGPSSDSSGATPLKKNSDVPADSIAAPKMASVQISPNPFSPDGDGFDDITNITISVPSENAEIVSAKLYDLRGRLHKTFLKDNQTVDRVAVIPFDGKDDNGITLPIGLYTLVVESSSGLFSPERKGIVIIKKPK